MIPKDGGNTFSGSLFLGYQNEELPDRQPDRRTEGARAALDRRHRQAVQRRRRRRRPDQEGQGLVLRVGAQLRARHAAGRRVRRHSGHRRAESRAAAGRRAGRRRAEHQQRPGAHHLADQPEEQAGRLQRSPAEGPRRGDDRGPRSGDRSIVWNSPIYTTGSVKFTSTVSSQMLSRGRVLDQLRALQHASTSRVSRRSVARPSGITTINKQDTALGTSWNAGATQRGMSPDRFAVIGVGVVCHRRAQREGRRAGHLGQVRAVAQRQRRPARASSRTACRSRRTILNTPVSFQDNLDADFGVFAQDSWTLNRLTLNYGARWEYFASGIPERVSRPGRFVAASAVRSRSTCRPGRARRRASASSTTCSAIRRPR